MFLGFYVSDSVRIGQNFQKEVPLKDLSLLMLLLANLMALAES